MNLKTNVLPYNRGFGVVAVVVIVALLAIAGGAAYVATKNETSVTTNAENENGTGNGINATTSTLIDIDLDGDLDVVVGGNVDVNAGVDAGATVGGLLGTTPKTHTITYTDAGFSPSSFTIKAGDKVQFVDNAAGEMWVAADVHPTHTTYSGTSLLSHCPDVDGDDFDQCGATSVFEFTFTKKGSWEYHNHNRAAHTGTIVVE